MTANNFSLEDHWNQGKARAAIAKGGWSVVVLQQGPSALARVSRPAARLRQTIRGRGAKAGARTALYMVWPSKARSRDFDRRQRVVLRSRRGTSAARCCRPETRGARRGGGSPSLALYAEDGFHPSGLGSYLAALAIWRGLSGESVVGLPGPRGVSASTLGLLQESADRTAVRAVAVEGIRRPSMTDRPLAPCADQRTIQ